MLLKMSGVTILYIIMTIVIWFVIKGKKLKPLSIITIGLIYGMLSILSTHFAVDYQHMLLNVRDIGPLAAGLFFHPVAGVIAGLIGGIERYIAGTYWDIGSYTRIACGLSTCLAGLLTPFLSTYIFKRKKPGPVYAFFLGAVMEVFHMYVVLITHRDDMTMAYYVVKICSYPMILFTAAGMAVISTSLQMLSGEWKNPFKRKSPEESHLSDHFQIMLFAAIMVIFLFNFALNYTIQSQTAIQKAREILNTKSENIIKTYQSILKNNTGLETIYYAGGSDGSFDLIQSSGAILEGTHKNFYIKSDQLHQFENEAGRNPFETFVFNKQSLCKSNIINDGLILLTAIPLSDVYEDRDISTLETTYADILLIATVYITMSFLVDQIVVKKLDLVNASLRKITHGNLNEVVAVRSSSEFASLSNDINQTVDVLKGYIKAAEKRIEEELELARSIQDSALPKNFKFPRDDFEIYAIMNPAKEVGGDFYDFFFVGQNKLALVIADVSGKGIPAALFMMRSKTAIRADAEEGKSPADILYHANNTLCEGNDAEMFVTVWIGIIDLETGIMRCANAGHEYPAIMRADGDFELLKDKHTLALAAMEGSRAKEYEIDFHPGDRLFVYTDGVPEAINEKTEQYDTDRMLKVLNQDKYEPMEKILPDVRRDISEFVGAADQFDDITMLGFTYRGTHQSDAE